MLEASVTGKVKPIKYLCIIQYVQYSEKFEEKYDDVILILWIRYY